MCSQLAIKLSKPPNKEASEPGVRQDLNLWFSGRVQEFFNMNEGFSIEKESEMFKFWSDLSFKGKFYICLGRHRN